MGTLNLLMWILLMDEQALVCVSLQLRTPPNSECYNDS
jgi:hypothetical protein